VALVATYVALAALGVAPRLPIEDEKDSALERGTGTPDGRDTSTCMASSWLLVCLSPSTCFCFLDWTVDEEEEDEDEDEDTDGTLEGRG